MSRLTSQLIIVLVAAAVAASARGVMAGVDVRAEYDKKFDFKTVRTWAWNPKGPGLVKMGRSADDDPDAMQKRAEPIIVDAVTTELARVGLKPAKGVPDVIVTYYLLLTAGASSQTLGQFLPATPYWGLPPFAPATQSLTFMNEGSLVLDLSMADTIVWRGVAQAKIKPDTESKKREELLRESVRDLLRKYPKP